VSDNASSCRALARAMGVPEPDLEELCRDRHLQECAKFYTGESTTLDSLIHCYGVDPNAEEEPTHV
jgi:hypothetical protein